MFVTWLLFSGLWFYNIFNWLLRFSFSIGWVRLLLELFLKWLYMILLHIMRSTLLCCSILVILLIHTLLLLLFKSWESHEWGLFYMTPILSPSTIYYLIIVPIYIYYLHLPIEPAEGKKLVWLLNICSSYF